MSLLCLCEAESELLADMAPPADWLTRTELDRHASLGTAGRRDTFLAGRWLARRAAQRWLSAPDLPPLAVAASGACEVIGRDGLFASISHSAGRVACAVSDVPVGVDIECLARPRDHLALAATVHGAAQCEQLAQLSAEARALPFMTWWTLKEAWLKARGRGLDFAVMRALSFEERVAGDVAVAVAGGFVLALAADPELPVRLDAEPGLAWQRWGARLSS